MGQDYGLTATEMNLLLEEEGFLVGRPGAWSVTEKGKPCADEQDHHAGTGGYPCYNRYWDTRTWHPSITDQLDITDERKRQVREAAHAARQQTAALRAAQAAAFDSANVDDRGPNNAGLSPLALAVGLGLAAVSIFGIWKIARHVKKLRADKATQKPRDVEEPDRRRHKTQAETPDSDENPST